MHRIDGPGATVDNKFTDGDPVGGVQATVVTDDFLNDVQEELISVLAAAGVTPVKGTQDQVLQAIYKLAQSQKATAFTAGGSATVLTLTPTPAISAYAANQRFTVKFPVNSGLNPTLNISAKGAKSLKQYDAAGAKVPAVFVADQVGDVVYDGVDHVLLDQLPTGANNLVGIQGAFKTLIVSTGGADYFVSVSAEELILEDPAGGYRVVRGISVAPSMNSSGANGVDTGTSASGNWYSVWVISNGSTIAGLLSLSDTAPAMPAGYTFKARVGWVRTDGSRFPLRYSQYGRSARYDVGSNVPAYPTVASGISATATTVALNTVVPPTAKKACLVAGTSNGGYVGFAPVGSFTSTPGSGYLSPSQPNGFPFAGGYNASSPVPTTSGEIHLRSNSVMYCASGTGSILQCMGWEDNL